MNREFVSAIIPQTKHQITYKPRCYQYIGLPPGRLVYTGRRSFAGNCSPNPDNSFDFWCHIDRNGRQVCQGSNGAVARNPNALCCPRATIPWGTTPRDTIPRECCVQDTNSCAKCLTNYFGNQTGSVAGNHQKNMSRCRNACGIDQGTPQNRLLLNN
jgi:hypothetical protein